MSVSGASRATCARSLYENFLCKMSVSESPHQDPVQALVQDLCMRISCARCLCQDLLSKTTCARSLYADLLCISLCQDLCLRIFYDHLCKISVWGSLPQDLCGRIFASGSCRTSCARSLYGDLLRKVLKISSAESCRSTWARSVYDLLCQMSVSRSPRVLPEHLSKISVCGSLVQDLSVRMSAAGSCRTTLARPLHQDLLRKISLSGSPQDHL